MVERPATLHGVAFQLRLGVREFVGKNGQAKKGGALQFLRDVEPIFAQSSLAGGESGYQTNFHCTPVSGSVEVR